MDVHSYVHTQIYLFKNILNQTIVDNPSDADIIWSTQDKKDYDKFKLNYPDKLIINEVHGGGYNAIKLLCNTITKPNLILKSVEEYNKCKLYSNPTVFIGKYANYSNIFRDIYSIRAQKIFTKNNFLILHGFFNYNNDAIKNTYNHLINKYEIDLFGYDSPKGWVEPFSDDINNNILLNYKFYLHLKGLGYLCNSALVAFMTRENYQKTLYSQFIPEDLIIFIDNYDCNTITVEQVKKSIDKAINMSNYDYNELSNKCYIHGTYFRTYYADEINNILHYINTL
jgi:hypothetical protein